MLRRAAIGKGAGVAAAVLLCVRVAASQEPTRNDGGRPASTQTDGAASEQLEALRALQLEVKALQEEIVRLRAQVAKVDGQLGRLHLAPPDDSAPLDAHASKVVSGGDDAPSICMPPYIVADDGIKRFRTECVARPPCDPPFFVDEAGIKRFRNECMEPAGLPPGDTCNPPYYLMQDGTKLFKLQCL
jgi:hypothetical protein